MPIWSDFDRPQIMHKLLSMSGLELRGFRRDTFLSEEVDLMGCGCSIATDGLQGRTQNLLVVVEPSGLQFIDQDRLKVENGMCVCDSS